MSPIPYHLIDKWLQSALQGYPTVPKDHKEWSVEVPSRMTLALLLQYKPHGLHYSLCTIILGTGMQLAATLQHYCFPV